MSLSKTKVINNKFWLNLLTEVTKNQMKQKQEEGMWIVLQNKGRVKTTPLIVNKRQESRQRN